MAGIFVANRFGSKAGLLASTRISPVDGSSATTAPTWSPRAFSAARCRSRSSVVRRSFPANGFFGAETLDFSLPIVDDNSAIAILPAKDRVITKFKSEFADLISGLVLLQSLRLQFVGRHFTEITDGMSSKFSFEITPPRLILDKDFILKLEFAGIDERDIGDVDIFLQDDWTILRLRPTAGDAILDVLWSEAQSRSQHVDDLFERMARALSHIHDVVGGTVIDDNAALAIKNSARAWR